MFEVERKTFAPEKLSGAIHFDLSPYFSILILFSDTKGQYNRDVEQILETNIFFYITSVAVVVVAVLVCIALYYIIGILQNVRDVTDRIRRGSEQLAEDASEFREQIIQTTTPIRDVAAFVGRRTGWFEGGKKKRAKRKSTKKPKTEE